MTPSADEPLIYLIAGEASGDLLGARLMEALRKRTGGSVRFAGIGGPRMTASGLTSLFPYDALSLMGFVEILPHALRLRRDIRRTVDDIARVRPAGVITIDSPGFCKRVVAALRRDYPDLPTRFIHYVAPTVWAYRPKRAETMAALFDFLMVLLPFEPPYFTAVGLPTAFVGHPIIKETENSGGQGDTFRQRIDITAEQPLIALLPGSRRGEIARHLPIYRETIAQLLPRFSHLAAVIITPPALQAEVKQAVKDWPAPVTVISDPVEKRDALAATNVALCKSGTVSLELSLARVPQVVTYRVAPMSAWLLKRMIRVRYVNLVNILLEREAIPELLQEDCRADRLAPAIERLLGNTEARLQQLVDAQAALAMLDTGTGESPSDAAARVVMEQLAAAQKA